MSPAVRVFEEDAKKAGLVVISEVGVDPCVDHLYAIKTINQVHSKGGNVSTLNTTTYNRM